MNLSNQVAVLEQGKDYLLDLLAPEIIWAEENLKGMGPKQRERVTEIVTAYRAVRPKEGDKGETSD